MLNDGYYLLCEAVIKQAVKDLKVCYKYQFHHDYYDRNTEDLENFLLGETDNPIPALIYPTPDTGKFIVNKLKKEVFDYV